MAFIIEKYPLTQWLFMTVAIASFVCLRFNSALSDDKFIECDEAQDGYPCRFIKTCGFTYARSSYIINGTDIKEGEFPSFAQILTNDYFCSGVIVSDYHIITSVKCLWTREFRQNPEPDYDDPNRFQPIEDIKVYVGTNKNVVRERLESQRIPDGALQVRKLCEHPYASGPLVEGVNDNAILLLKDRINFSHLVQPACWPYEPSLINAGKNSRCYQVGNGLTFKGSSYAEYVQKMQIKEIDCNVTRLSEMNKICVRNFDENAKATACHADFGGPGMCYNKDSRQWFVIGTKQLHGDNCTTIGQSFLLSPMSRILSERTSDECAPLSPTEASSDG